MKKHVHADKIMQFAQMVAAGYPVDKLVQIQNQGCPWRTVLPHWDADSNYRVACAFVGGTPLFEGDQAYVGAERGYVTRLRSGAVVFRNVQIIIPLDNSDVLGLLSLMAPTPATKQYEITHQIGDVSVTVRAPSAAECEQMVARLGESAESRELEPHETAVVDTLGGSSLGGKTMTLEEEMTDVCDWAWTEGLDAIDAKDEQYSEASAHVEMFLVLGAVLGNFGWTRDELISLLDECVFEDTVPADRVLH